MKLKEKIKQFPKGPGVYLMKDSRGRVLYIGKAKSLKSRLVNYFQPSGPPRPGRLDVKSKALVEKVTDVEYLEAESEVDALLMEARLIKDIQPRFNINLKDAKSYPFLQITRREDFPRVAITREPKKTSKLYGPFTDVKDLRHSLGIMQRIFQFRTCKLKILERDEKRRFQRPCLLFYLQRCSAPCNARVSKEEYRANIRSLLRFLDGKRTILLRELNQKMKAAAEALKFEQAAKLRNQIQAIEGLAKRGSLDKFAPAETLTINIEAGLEELKKTLGLSKVPRAIEGIDVANIAGAEAVGSLVTFIDGIPFKEGYRRFRIKTVRRIDDYGMIKEVVSRRYRRLLAAEGLLPDILLIDGGKGHLAASLEALKPLGLEGVKVISLAKREEEIFTQDSELPLRLPRRSSALRLLQFVRDEAHRFAQAYHHLLRSKQFKPQPKPKEPRLRKKSKK